MTILEGVGVRAESKKEEGRNKELCQSSCRTVEGRQLSHLHVKEGSGIRSGMVMYPHVYRSVSVSDLYVSPCTSDTSRACSQI